MWCRFMSVFALWSDKIAVVGSSSICRQVLSEVKTKAFWLVIIRDVTQHDDSQCRDRTTLTTAWEHVIISTICRQHTQRRHQQWSRSSLKQTDNARLYRLCHAAAIVKSMMRDEIASLHSVTYYRPTRHLELCLSFWFWFTVFSMNNRFTCMFYIVKCVILLLEMHKNAFSWS